MTRKSRARRGVARLLFHDPGYCSGNMRPALRRALMLPDLVGVFGAFPRAFLCLALPRRPKRNAGSSCLRKADGDGLLRRPGTALPTADLAYFIANKFASLRCG